ncbi:MAG: tRNA lysidine(34) synthetase TilS, partial [Mycoplasmataceae bacterium]|nr:tRNA lysidine(34) synthetase TilS [Mycoplasmataceae bacterium]
MAKYIAAVSGGPDSMAMLYMCRKQIVAVCHVNYQKRASASRDMLIVERTCEDLHIPLEKLIVTEDQYKRYYQKNKNFQNVAREIRYDFFIKKANKYRVDGVLIAHNKDDFLETALIQIKRKSKTLFLGIEKKSKYKNLRVFRPLLNKWKDELIVYCTKNNIPYGLDETNELDIYERNRIRKALNVLTSKEKVDEWKRIQKFNRDHSNKYADANKKYSMWKLNSFNIDFYCALSKSIGEQIIYRFLIENNIYKISANKIKLIDQFLHAQKTKARLRLG